MNLFNDKLSRKQQLALLAGGGAVLVLLLLQFLVFPFFELKKSASQAIANNEKVLAEMRVLGAEYRGLKRQAAKIQQVLSQRPPDFTLFSYLDKMAGAAGVKSNIKSINAGKGSISGPYEELPAEIRLEKITLKQLTDYLYLLESPQQLIRIKNISIAKMKENPDYLAMQIQVTTFQIAKGAGR